MQKYPAITPRLHHLVEIYVRFVEVSAADLATADALMKNDPEVRAMILAKIVEQEPAQRDKLIAQFDARNPDKSRHNFIAMFGWGDMLLAEVREALEYMERSGVEITLHETREKYDA